MGDTPLVSIIIPVYNGADYLAEAIDSALGQTYKHIEIIVVNDGSTDGGATAEVARSYGDRIRYFEKANGGVATALNLGIEMADGEFISWLSHDDYFLPEKTERQMAFLKSLGGWVVVYGDWQYVSPDRSFLSIERSTEHVAQDQRIAFLLDRRVKIHGCATLIPRAVLIEVGGFDPKWRTVQDYDLWFRLSRSLSFRHHPEVLTSSRVHGAQGSVTMHDRLIREGNELLSGVLAASAEERWYERVGLAPVDFYILAARSLAVRKLSGASRFALRLARRYSATSGERLKVAAYAFLTECICLVRRLRLMRLMMWVRRSHA